jgi:hypothetical protein
MNDDKATVTTSNDWREINEVIAGIGESVRGLARWWEANRETVANAVGWALSSLHFAGKLESTGWLPHYTTPDLVFGLEDAAYDAEIARHYADNWPAVEAAFLGRLARYDVDEEAKAAFGEALQAHRMGLFRVAPRLLFPEIERIFRAELGDAMQITAGLGYLREAANQLGSENFVRTGVLTLRLYRAFVEHVYARVESDEEVARAQANPVPNRNAAIHGRVIYNSQKTSLNALILAEYVLLTVGGVRAARAVGAIAIASQAQSGNVLDGVFPHVAGNLDWQRLIPSSTPAIDDASDQEPTSGANA